MITKKMLRVLGVVTTVAGGALTLLSGWVEDKKMQQTIVEEVEKALAKKK